MQVHEQENCTQPTLPRAAQIAQLNDKLRRECFGGRIVVTRGARSLPGFEVSALLQKLRDYDGFDADNDPHGERDFGDFDFCGASLFFKIDYYSPDMRWASENPADSAQTLRILTVMLVDEY